MKILTLTLMLIRFTGQLFKLQAGKVLFPGKIIVSNTVKRWG